MTKAQISSKKEKESNMGVKDSSVDNKTKKLKINSSNKVASVKKNQKNISNANGSLASKRKTKNKQSSNKGKAKIKNNELESDCEDFNSENDNESCGNSDESVENNITKKKGIKMFQGLKPVKNESNENKNDDEDDSEVSEEEDDSEDDENETEDCGIGLKALLGDSIADDDDDEDFNEANETDDDDDISDDDEEETTCDDSKQNVDNDDDDEEEEEDDSDDNAGLGLKALLDESLVDEEDDDDFKGDIEEDDDEDDISDESNEDESIDEFKSSKKILANNQENSSNVNIRLTEEEQAELDARTIFVGNVPNETSVKTIKQLFRSCGEIENVRIRGVVPDESRMSFKVATITKKMHPKVKSMYIFIAFKDKSSVTEALKLNGCKLGNNTLRVDHSNLKNKDRDQKKSVFIGNLPFDITEDEVRAHFTSCGNIESVRVVRDRKSGLSRGIGYVNFVEEDSVSLALNLHDTLLKNCNLRVKIYCPNPKGKKRKHSNNKQNNDFKKKFKNNKGKDITIDNTEKKGNKRKISQGEIKREKSNKNQKSTSGKIEKMDVSFQGQKADIKKKIKINKMDKKKKIMAEKLIKKSKKMTD